MAASVQMECWISQGSTSSLFWVDSLREFPTHQTCSPNYNTSRCDLSTKAHKETRPLKAHTPVRLVSFVGPFMYLRQSESKARHNSYQSVWGRVRKTALIRVQGVEWESITDQRSLPTREILSQILPKDLLHAFVEKMDNGQSWDNPTSLLPGSFVGKGQYIEWIELLRPSFPYPTCQISLTIDLATPLGNSWQKYLKMAVKGFWQLHPHGGGIGWNEFP